MWKLLLAAVVFYAFIPGVLVTLPSKGSKLTINVVHALLFSVTMYYLMKVVKQYDYFGNHGPAGCPPSHTPGYKDEKEVCIPLPGTRQNPPGFSSPN